MAYIPNSGSVAGWIQSDNASVITVSQSSIAAVIVGGSIAASFVPPANQSVSGTVKVQLVSTNASIITVSNDSSVIAYQLAGSILATSVTINPAANQSVSGTVGASVIGTVPVTFASSIYGNISGSVAATVTNTVTVVSSIAGGIFPISGSVAATVTNFPANQSVSGTVGASIIGLPPFVLGGSTNASVITVGTPAANQSVSGTVNIAGNPSISGTVLVNNGSVVAFQGTNPWTVVSSIAGGIFPVSGSVAAVVTNNVTVVSSISGGIFPISGSVAAVITNSPTVIVNNGSVVAFQGTSPWVVAPNNSSLFALQPAGSILAISGTLNAPANQSVSGTVGASIIGTVPVTFVNSSISGTVIANQGTTPWLIGSVYGNVSGSIAGTYTSSTVATTVTGLAVMFKPDVSASIMTEVSPRWPLPITGAVAASISGTVATTLSGNPSISGTVLVNNGSVVAFQGGAPWANTNVGSIITASQGSIAAVIIGGSIATATTNSSVMLLNSANVIGSVATLQGTNPWVVTSSIAGGLFPISGSVAAVVTNLQGASVSGTVNTLPLGTIVSSLVSTVPSSVIVGTSIFGQLPAGTAMLGSIAALQAGTVPWLQTFSNSSIIALQVAGSILATSATVNMANSSVMLLNGANVIGSVTALQGTNPWIQTFSNSSIIAINAGSVVALSSGSVITVFQNSSLFAVQAGTRISSVVNSIPSSLLTGNYVQRNDTIASALGGDLTWRPLASDSAGRTIIKPFSADDSATFYYQGSVVSGSVTLIQASAVGKRSYVTDFFVANTGATTTLVTFKDGSTSILGNTVAPTGGGSNVPGIAIPFRTNPSQDLVYTAATATSVLYMTVQGYQAP